MSFWAIEITPGSAFETVPPYDLHVTQLVLPASATDKGRTVVQCKVANKSFALGSLKLDLQENVHSDLIFDAGEPIELSIATGKNPVQMLGYYVDAAGVDDSDDDDLGEYDDLYGEEGMQGIEGGSDSDEEVDEDELAEATLQAVTKRKAEDQPSNGTKKPKVDGEQAKQSGEKKQGEPKSHGEQKQPKGEQKPQQPKGEQKPQQPKGEQKPQQPKGEQKPQQPKGEKQKQPKGEQKQQQPKGEQTTKAQTPAKEQKTEGSAQKDTPIEKKGQARDVRGVTVQKTKIGLGAKAELGKKVSVMYVGRLKNGKVFDSSKIPFSFVLGIGQVIKGWDIGVDGMRVGEKRKLTIPPQLGYGKAGAGPIPGGATLEFDVELIKIQN